MLRDGQLMRKFKTRLKQRLLLVIIAPLLSKSLSKRSSVFNEDVRCQSQPTSILTCERLEKGHIAIEMPMPTLDSKHSLLAFAAH